MKQKDFVKAALLAARGREVAEGQPAFTAEQNISFAVEQVKLGLMDGTCPHKSGKLDEKAATAYAKGVVGNYLKKDEDLNGGVKYAPKTKRGPIVKDERLKDLIIAEANLVANKADEALIATVRGKIEERRAELEAAKASKGKPVLTMEQTMALLSKHSVIESTDETDGEFEPENDESTDSDDEIEDQAVNG